MATLKIKTVPVLEFKPTTAKDKLQFPPNGSVRNADKYRLHFNGVPQPVAYTYRKRKEMYWSKNIHRQQFYRDIKNLSSAAFPDNSSIDISLFERNWCNNMISSLTLCRKKNVFTVSFCVTLDDTEKIDIWDEDTYMKELKVMLKQEGCEIPYFDPNGDSGLGAILVASFVRSTAGTIEKNVYESLLHFEKVVKEVENKLLPLVK